MSELQHMNFRIGGGPLCNILIYGTRLDTSEWGQIYVKLVAVAAVNQQSRNTSAPPRTPLARFPEKMWFRLCVLAFRCFHGTALSYRDDSLHRNAAADVDGRRHLRSINTESL